MATTLGKMTLQELYERPKITDAVFKNIIAKEDFTSINPEYCKKVCTFPEHCKDPASVTLNTKRKVEYLFVSRHAPLKDGWKDPKQVELVHKRIVGHILEEMGVSKLSWAYEYIAKCQPDTKLTKSKCARCFPYLREQIRKMRPSVIISLHTEVSKVLGMTRVSNTGNRGVVGYYEDAEARLRIPVVVTLHPETMVMIRQNSSGAMWGPDYYGILYNDIRKAVKIATGSLRLKTFDEAMAEIRNNGQIIITRSLQEVHEQCDKILALPHGTLVSWDTETSGLDPWAPGAKLLTTQFGYRRDDGLVQAVVIPLWHKANLAYNPDEAWEHVARVLLSPITKVAHNAKFDLLYTTVTTGVRPENVDLDTMLLIHALNSGVSGNYSLKTAVWDLLLESGLGGYEDRLVLSEGAGGLDDENSGESEDEVPTDYGAAEDRYHMAIQAE